MKKIGYFRKGTCLFAAVLMLGGCGQADRMEMQPSETETEVSTEALVESTGSGEKESTSEEKKTDTDDSQSKEKEMTEETSKEEETSDKEKETEEDKDAEKQNIQPTEKSEEAEEAEDGQREETQDPDAEAASKLAQEEEASKLAQEEEASKLALEEASRSAEEEASRVAKEQAEATAPQQSAGKNVNDIYSEITQKVALNMPMVVPNDFITNYYGIDLSTLDEYVFSMSEAATSAETVVILKAKDAGSTDSLSASLQTVVDQKRSEMENYLPDQFQIVDRSSVQVKGNYVYLVISEQADAINQIIQAGIQ